MEGLLLASLFACGLSFHDTLNRYLFAAGREGLLWRGLGRTHPDHVGVDVDEGMLSVARGAARDEGAAAIDWRTTDAASLPFADGTFDAVLCFRRCSSFRIAPGHWPRCAAS